MNLIPKPDLGFVNPTNEMRKKQRHVAHMFLALDRCYSIPSVKFPES